MYESDLLQHMLVNTKSDILSRKDKNGITSQETVELYTRLYPFQNKFGQLFSLCTDTNLILVRFYNRAWDFRYTGNDKLGVC